MKSLTLLWRESLIELGDWCRVSTTQDLKTVLGRIEYEGLSFLTITLPIFGSDFQKSLDSGILDRSLFQGFTWKGRSPLLFGGFLDLVFDRSTGCLLASPSTDAIFAIRQLTLSMAKILLPTSDRRNAAAIEGYIDCERVVRDNDRRISSDYSLSEFRKVSSVLWSSPVSIVDKAIYDGRLLPKHGPGATADRLRGNAKFGLQKWSQRLEEYFPSGEYLLPNWRYYSQLDHVELLKPGAELPVRVILVPKTLKTPRIIAIEPTAMQYSQQAVSIALVRELERDNLLSSFIGFSDQSFNQDMAREGSLTGELATLDLSDASDRVSNQLVREMTAQWPWFAGAIQACRSRSADVPGHGVIRLAKFASMGSALCFPIEAMVFLTIIFGRIAKELKQPISRKLLKDFRGKVRVYGDDIVVPVEYARSVSEELESFGMKVNLNKSFWTGKFRESCGKEYYNGVDVSIVRFRRVLPTSRKDAQELISLVESRNLFFLRGLWGTAAAMDKIIEKIIPFPCVGENSPTLGRRTFLPVKGERLDPNLHIPLVKGAVVRARVPVNPARDMSALLKCLLMLEHRSFGDGWRALFTLPGEDSEHLERSGRPRSVDIKIGWTPAL